MDDEHLRAVRKSHELIEEAREELLTLRREIDSARETVSRSLEILSRIQSSAEESFYRR